MPSIANRALSVYREDGVFVLGKKALRRAYIRSYCQAISYLGSYSLALGTQTVEFYAPTPTMVERNRKRYKSEYDELDSFLQTIQADDVVYDIGANTGLYSLFAAGKCEQGSIVAFEPYPPNVEVLRRDITRNNFHNIEVMELGLSSTVGEVEFSQPSKEDVGYGSSSIKVESGDSTIKIPTTTVGRLVANGVCPPPNVVKIDVEGAEPLVIEGMEKILSASNCRVVFCEIHLSGVDRRPSVDDFGSSPDELISKLEGFGYTTEKIGTSSESEITVKATK